MFRRMLVLVLVLAITACSDSDRNGRGAIVDPVDNTPPAVGVLLTGAGTSPALQSFQRVGPASVNPADVRDGFVLSRLEVAIDPVATVDQVNAALRVVGGGIVTMRPGLPIMVVAVPLQVDAVALRTLADQFAAAPGVRFALPARTEALLLAPAAPANSPPSFSYLQDGRFPAAWNARRAAGSCLDPVALLVADVYHRPADVLYNDFATQVPGVQDIGGAGPPLNPSLPGEPDNGYFDGFHGYDVFMTAVAAIDGTLPTGAFPYPDCLEKSAVQVYDVSGRFDMAFRLVESLPASGKVVLNASFGYGDCGKPCTAATLRPVKAIDRALYGVFLRALLEPHVDRLLLVSAAGNSADEVSACYYPGIGRAEYASMFNVAATSDAEMSWVSDPALWTPRPDAICDPTVAVGSIASIAATAADRATLDAFIRDMGQTGAVPLPNVLIVGSSNGLSPSEFSNEGASINAVGEGIQSLLGRAERGTSLAAPQISALAASLWLMSDELRELTAAEAIATILANHSSFPADLVDAYLAVLSLYSGLALSRENSRIRLALLDAVENDVFNSDDLRPFHAAYFDNGVEIEPSSRDDSRYDLNGDGFTGGSRVKSFDLDPQSSARFGARNLTDVSTEVRGVPKTYDELAVTDLDILCFYAWSPLYSALESEQAARDELLGEICTPVSVEIAPPDATVVAGDTVQFNATVRGSLNSAVTWSLPTGGGSISADGMFTAGTVSGSYTVRAASVADPNANDTVVVTVGIPRSWVGTVMVSETSSLSKRVVTPPSDSFVDGIRFLGSTNTLEVQSSISVAVPVEIEFQGILGSTEDFTVGEFAGSGFYNYAEDHQGEYVVQGSESCVLQYRRGRWTDFTTPTSATADGLSLRLGTNGSYTLYVGSVGLAGLATERTVDINQDSPSNATDCYVEVGNVDSTQVVPGGVSGNGLITEVVGQIINGQMTGTVTETVDLGASFGDGSTGSVSVTVTWSLNAR